MSHSPSQGYLGHEDEADEPNAPLLGVRNKNRKGSKSTRRESRGIASLYSTQFLVLGQKSFLLTLRNWRSTIGQLSSPIFIVLLLLGFQQLSNHVLSRDFPHPETSPLGTFPRCTDRKGEHHNCKTVIYTPKGCEWVDNLMRKVAEDTKLNFENDFEAMGDGIPGETGFVNDNRTIYDYILNNQNKTQTAVIFTTAYIHFYQSTLPKDVGFILFYNATDAKQNDFDTPAEMFVNAIDQASISMDTGQEVKLNVMKRAFPRAKLRIAGYDVVAANGGVWFYIPPMITFFIILTEIVMEKEQRLRLGMKMMGLKNSVYWIVWFLTGAIYVTFSTLVLIGAGAAAQFKVFTNSNFFVVFLLFFLFGMAILSVAFFVSTLISRSKTAQTAGYAIILLGFVFQSILCSGYGILVDLLYDPDLHTWIKIVRTIFIMYPPFNLAKTYSDIAALSSSEINMAAGTVVNGPGFTWGDLYKIRTIDSIFGLPQIHVPPPINSFYYLLVNIIFFLILTWYFDNVLPGEHGTSRPWYFFLTPDYWGFSRKRKKTPIVLSVNSDENLHHEYTQVTSDTQPANAASFSRIAVPEVIDLGYDSDVTREEQRAILIDPKEVAVKVSGVSKVYQKKLWSSKDDLKAVDGVSFVVEKGEIFCLLGHNGAGKTTTINMLTGLFPPSHGSALVNGHDVVDDMDEIRKSMGVTPQHDILWPELTAMEHLRLFAKLKGISNKEANIEIEKRLKQMGLYDVREQRVKTFSGGMKRRLSVAIATIGGPKIIYMDEPSTGMDPVNRRTMWSYIEDLKQEASIILTTHSMEEAQNLADRIGIMAFGKLCCIGNALHLKNKYGVGYRVEVMTETVHTIQLIHDVRDICSEATTAHCDAGSVTFNIPTSSLEKIPLILHYLEEKSAAGDKDTAMVKEFGVSHTTLEEVFLEVTKKHNFKYDDNNEMKRLGTGKSDGNSNSSSTDSLLMDESLHSEKKRKSFPYKALLRKNFSLQKRQKGTNICQILTPVFVTGIMLLLQLIIRSELGKKVDQKYLVDSFPYPINIDTAKYLDIPSVNGSCLEFFLYHDPTHNGDSSQIFKHVVQRNCTLYNETVVKVPYFLPRRSMNEMDDEVMHDQEIYNKKPLHSINTPPLMYLLPDGTINFNRIQYVTTEKDPYIRLNYTFNVNDLPLHRYHRRNYLTRAGAYGQDLVVIAEGKIATVSLINRAFRRAVKDVQSHEISSKNQIPSSVNNSTEIAPSFAPFAPTGFNPFSFLYTRFVQAMPFYATANILTALEVVGTLLYPVALTIQLPIYLYILVMEKGGTKELMKSHGMKISAYIVSNYLFSFALYTLAIIFFWLSGVAIHIRFFSQTNPFVLGLFFFGWGHLMISLAFFLSTFINTTRTATVVGYVVALMGSLIGLVICIGIYGYFPWSLNTNLPIPLLLVPQFAFIRGIYLMNYQCAENFACYGPIRSASFFANDELGNVLLFLYIDALIFMVAALYLEAVMPRDFGVPKHPLFFLQPIKRLFGKGGDGDLESQSQNSEKQRLLSDEENGSSSNNGHSHNNNGSATSNGHSSNNKGADEDCIREEERVHNLSLDEIRRKFPLVIKDLHKKYPSPAKNKPQKVAVKKLCMSVEQDQCFGLLGENGAGKTTTISIATGLITPTSGTAIVAGFDIRDQIDQVHLNIGICPQFSVLWEGLTVEEHLLFYARLKGIEGKEEKNHIKRCLRRYGLMDQKDRLAKDLSGGMQRRLSVAIALVGDSKIVFLDEPTTGLDPSSKRQLWKIINDAKYGRAIVLTTHSMEEAELLCDRIGIVAKGDLRCIGTPLHLKNKFADGYCLQINHEIGNEEGVTASMESLFGKNLREVATYRGTKEYRLSLAGGKISEVFSRMEQNAKLLGITDWSLSQVGLEDVFQHIVEESRKD